jgi:transmembrane sensor
VNDARLNELRAEQIAQEAAAWVLRSDRGLTAAEQDEFSSWLASDPRHGEQLARHRRHWNRLDRLAQWRPEHGDLPNPELLAPPPNQSRRVWRLAALPLAAAAAIALVLWLGQPARHVAAGRPTAAATAIPAEPSASRVLEDGTMVDLNRGAILTTRYSPGERRVILEHGEAHFAVTKDPGRPFIVQAGGVDVRAVGTAFNVRIDAAAVEVLVTEGRVQLDSIPGKPGAVDTPARVAPPVLEARQRAVVLRGAAPPPPQIDTLTRGEIERVLAWQQRLLDFNATPLREIVAEFNRRNVVQLVVSDAELASVRISAAFRSDNIEGFVSLLEAGFGARAERRGETEIVLRRVTAEHKPD